MLAGIGTSFAEAFALLRSGDKLLGEIVSTTMHMAMNSTLWASLLGILIGCLIALNEFKGKKVLVTILRTLMGLPPVAVGILLYLLFSGTGPFGKLNLIYSVPLMIIAQVILITPIVAGMVETALSPISIRINDTAKGLRLNPFKRSLLMINEGKLSVISSVMFAFARATAEVGAVQIVGGNILHSTRVMTTTIMMNYNTGSFELALALAIILLGISLGVNILATLVTIIGKKR